MIFALKYAIVWTTKYTMMTVLQKQLCWEFRDERIVEEKIDTSWFMPERTTMDTSIHMILVVLGAHESPMIYRCGCRTQETHGLWSTRVLGKSCVEYWKVCLMHKYRWIFDYLPIKQFPYFSRTEIYKIFNIVFQIDIHQLSFLSFSIQSIYWSCQPLRKNS